MLLVNNITKSYESNILFQEVSFSLDSGEILVLKGPSGSGKSTILKMLNGLVAWDSGDITIHGEKVHPYCKHAKLGFVSQSYDLFSHLNVLSNIMMPMIVVQRREKRLLRRYAEQLLSEFGLADLGARDVASLSGGQQQRLAIARSLALEPDILCLDEPTAALDSDRTEMIADMLHRIVRNGKAVLLTTHDACFIEMINGRMIDLEAASIDT